MLKCVCLACGFGVLLLGPPCSAQQLGLSAFTERQELYRASGARLTLRFDLDRLYHNPQRFPVLSAWDAGAVTDRAVTDRAVTDRAVTDRAVTDRAVTDRAVTDGAGYPSATEALSPSDTLASNDALASGELMNDALASGELTNDALASGELMNDALAPSDDFALDTIAQERASRLASGDAFAPFASTEHEIAWGQEARSTSQLVPRSEANNAGMFTQDIQTPAAPSGNTAAEASTPHAPGPAVIFGESSLRVAAVPRAAAVSLRANTWSTPFLLQLIDHVVSAQKQTSHTLEDAVSRARLAGCLPVLSLRAGRNTDQSLRLTPTDADPDRWQLTGGADLRLEAQASWDLDRLAFAPEEVAFERLRAQQLAVRRELGRQVLGLAFRWQKANATLASPDLLADEQLRFELELQSAEAELDVLSAGWFSNHRDAAWQPRVGAH